MVVSLKELPKYYDSVMHLGPNPRRPLVNKKDRQPIKDALETDGENFHLLNGGLFFVAKQVDVESKGQDEARVRIHLAEDEDEAEIFGLLDGGHTNEIINNFRDEVVDDENGDAGKELSIRFVNVEVMIPDKSIPEQELKRLLRSISAARNNNLQVRKRDLKNLEHAFDSIKDAIANEPYADLVRWREGDPAQTIDGENLIILLMMYHQYFRSYEDDPIGCYGQKAECRDAFCEHLEDNLDYTQRLIKQAAVLFRLFDKIEREFPDAHNKAGGKFQKFANVVKKESKTFFRNKTDWKYPPAWVYPIYGGFRQLLHDDGQKMTWLAEPLSFWEEHKLAICRSYRNNFSELAKQSATKVGRNGSAFQACRQEIRTKLLESELRFLQG